MLMWPVLVSSAFALGDAATRFQVFVPPNNVSRRDVSLSVTAVSTGITSVFIDDDDTDGDSDDSVAVSLEQGETYVLYLREGAVNDDAGGKQDGDYFTIQADKPVTALVATDSNWQHDWAPSDGRSSRGTSFLLWSPATSGQPADLDVYAYEDDTRVTIEDVTITPTVGSGITQVDLASGTTVLDKTLDEGEDLNRRHGLGVDLFEEGHTYRVRATRPVTVQAGHLDTLDGANQARDGGGFVPGASGGAMADRYYLSIPHNPGRESEKELRAVAWEDYAEVQLYGWSEAAGLWNLIDVRGIDAWQTADWVGATDPLFRSYDLYRVDVPNGTGVVLFEANWMETGAPGTSDYMSSVTSSEGTGSGTDFVAYLGPPGDQRNWAGGHYTRVSVYAAEAATDVRLLDLATNGGLHFDEAVIPAGGHHDFLVDTATWDAMNDPAAGLRPYVLIRSAEPVSVTVGNHNDNFMAWLTSPLSPEPSVVLSIDEDHLLCGDATDAQVEVRNSLGSPLDGGRLSLALPEGVVASTLSAPGHGAPEPTAEGVAWSAPDLSPGAVQVVDLRLSYDCDQVLTCPPEGLATVTARRSAQLVDQTYATNDSRSLALTRDAGDAASPLQATWNADLGATELRWTVDQPRAGTRWTLSRSTAPDGPWTELEVAVADGTRTDFLTVDGTANQGDEAFYRVVATDTLGCERTLGPERVAITSPPSGASGGGLESNGRLASALARRAVARTRGWDPLQEPRHFRTSTPLATWFPAAGPSGSQPEDATPWDLPGVTNATHAEGRDYLAPDGRHLASLLVVETQDAPYEHTKALCDRAAGGTVEQVVLSPLFPDGDVPRSRIRTADGTRDWSTSVVVAEAPGAPARAYASWLVQQLPPQPPGTRFTTLQAWSARPGHELALLEDALATHGLVAIHRSSDAPPTWAREVLTLGGTTELTLDGHLPTQAEVAARREDGQWERWRQDLSSPQVALQTGPALELSLTLLDPHGRPVDHVWASDGAWAPFDDGIWEGPSRTTAFDALCSDPLPADAPSGLALAGCATATTTVGPGGFGGVARHLARPVSAGVAAAAWVRSNRSAMLCVHGSEGRRPCVSLPAAPKGAWVAMDLSTAGPEGEALGDAHLVEVFTEGEGHSEVMARGLTFLSKVPAEALSPVDRPVGADPTERAQRVACGCQGVTWVDGLFWLTLTALLSLRRRP